MYKIQVLNDCKYNVIQITPGLLRTVISYDVTRSPFVAVHLSFGDLQSDVVFQGFCGARFIPVCCLLQIAPKK
jgi:hypothetical protein